MQCADYIGCFKPRDNADNRLRLQNHRWYDPHWQLFEGDGSMYAEGPFYIIHGSIVDGLVRSGLTVRMGGPNEGQSPMRPITPLILIDIDNLYLLCPLHTGQRGRLVKY